ncbi:hypothetical protein CCHL11_02471 [Colletotrichum chlorophyti]|uniref:Uncharacterized protein n=1 Tax=Colletotrichum chlorophyti TaxID=708187 RepID=A0A1Q8S8Z9_9PEZI|nr:hypothetical protein CCHL11_02471 [Colletotrichum chlorophyti]
MFVFTTLSLTHANGILELVGLPVGSTRQQLSEKIAYWASIDLETAATVEGRLATYALRSYSQWDALPQSKAINNFPIDVNQISPHGPKGLPVRLSGGNTKCLQGLCVVEMSRVIAAPLAGKTLAAHGADVIWTCSGMNISEAEHAGKGEAARPTPFQALDHAGGYWLAFSVMAALYKRAIFGGSWRTDVSLAGVMKYLRSLGQYPGDSGFKCKDYEKPEDVPENYYETKKTGFGRIKAIKYSGSIEGFNIGWHVMPKPLGSDSPEWL